MEVAVKTFTVVFQPGYYDEGYEFKEVKAPSDVAAALKVANNMEKAGQFNTGSIEFRVFEGTPPTPIVVEIERSVKLRAIDG
jgi:hypothetical protein